MKLWIYACFACNSTAESSFLTQRYACWKFCQADLNLYITVFHLPDFFCLSIQNKLFVLIGDLKLWWKISSMVVHQICFRFHVFIIVSYSTEDTQLISLVRLLKSRLNQHLRSHNSINPQITKLNYACNILDDNPFSCLSRVSFDRIIISNWHHVVKFNSSCFNYCLSTNQIFNLICDHIKWVAL